jgi:hypothetical protein
MYLTTWRFIIFENNDWWQIGQTSTGLTENGNFGVSVAVGNNGTIVMGGEPFELDSIEMGHVRVLHLVGNVWQQSGNTIVGMQNDDKFGQSLARSNDGYTITIGGDASDDSVVGFIVAHQLKGDTWQQLGGCIDGIARRL